MCPRQTAAVTAFHSRNRHQGRYDFAVLQAASPALAPFVRANPTGEPTIDFADPRAVKALNRALLAAHYGVAHWDVADGFLCPPIPGRADYIHQLADVLATDCDGVIPQGAAVRVLDVGVGANCIYPLLGYAEYGWHFIGSDIDRAALRAAQSIVDANPGLNRAIACRLQPRASAIFSGVVRAGERFALTLCNPPFHASAVAAAAGSLRKQRNLARGGAPGAPVLNFGGRYHELCCDGGERAFVIRMAQESRQFASQCAWFSTLLSKGDNLVPLRRALQHAGAREIRVLAMAQGQKQSRAVAWSFLALSARRALCTAAPAA